MKTSIKVPAKNQFKCYSCREIILRRDGDWFNWAGMQVHLCRSCEKTTQTKPERTQKG